jgi:P-type E1-E2 ATPase
MQFPKPIWSAGFAFCGIALFGLVAGGGLALGGSDRLVPLVWTGATLLVLAALLFEIVTSLHKGQVGLDVVAALSMSAAVIFGEPLAGNVVALIYAGGQLLEQFAQDGARREMTALLGRVAHTAMRFGPHGPEEVAIERIVPGNRLLIRHGEVIPVNGQVGSGHATIDTSALTGEPMPVERVLHEEVLSGTTSVGPAFELQVLRPASANAYAGIVRLVEAAQQTRAPAVRLADHYALWFLLLTVLLAGLAWVLADDPLRALAVLMVATSCPLILAVPVAIMAGISRAAGMGVLVKGGEALEVLGQCGSRCSTRPGH